MATVTLRTSQSTRSIECLESEETTGPSSLSVYQRKQRGHGGVRLFFPITRLITELT